MSFLEEFEREVMSSVQAGILKWLVLRPHHD